MTIMTIRIPDDVKEAFDKAFEGRDKDAIIADLIRRAAAEAKSGEARGSDEGLMERFRKFRESLPDRRECRQSRRDRRNQGAVAA